MDEIGLFFSAKGRIDRKTFGWCVLAVYLLGFFSQAFLSGNVIARAGMWPFIFVQAALIWAWLALHIKRLRDANEGAAGAIGVAIVYSLAISLLFLVILIFGLLYSPDFGVFTTLLKILLLLACLPALVSLVFSLRTGLRKSVPPAPLPAPAAP
jgi:uncharacterized membrane protein YhaH (DUF805 family)